MELSEHLKSITRDQFQNAIAKINFASRNSENSVSSTLHRATKYEILDEIIKTIQIIGHSDTPDGDAINRLVGMKIVVEALILIAESENKK